jgi:hypothetical protein
MDIAQVIEQYHSALNAFATGDPAPVKSLYTRRDDVLLANPFGGSSRGWNDVSDALDFASSRFRDGKQVRCEEVVCYTGADLVTLFEIEHWETKVGGRSELSPFDLRVTSTFRAEAGDWKLVSRHADSLTSTHVDGPLRPSS